jgi:hypothetical protein
MNPTCTTPTPLAVEEARNLLAGVLDANLDLEPLLTACDAYNHLEQAHNGLWSPSSSTVIEDPAAALEHAHTLLTDTLHHRPPGLDPIQLALAILATAAALALLSPGGDAA